MPTFSKLRKTQNVKRAALCCHNVSVIGILYGVCWRRLSEVNVQRTSASMNNRMMFEANHELCPLPGSEAQNQL